MGGRGSVRRAQGGMAAQDAGAQWHSLPRHVRQGLRQARSAVRALPSSGCWPSVRSRRDGKTPRLSLDRYIGKRLRSTWSSPGSLRVGRGARTDQGADAPTRSRRYPGLEMLHVKGCIVTVDAMKYRIEDPGAPTTCWRLRGTRCRRLRPCSHLASTGLATTTSECRSRTSRRLLGSVTSTASDTGQWPELTTLVMVEGERQDDGGVALLHIEPAE